MAFQQVSTLGQSLVKIEARHTAGRTDARLDAQGVVGDEYDRAMMFFCQSPGHDANDAGVPVVTREHQSGRFFKVTQGFELFCRG